MVEKISAKEGALRVFEELSRAVKNDIESQTSLFLKIMYPDRFISLTPKLELETQRVRGLIDDPSSIIGDGDPTLFKKALFDQLATRVYNLAFEISLGSSPNFSKSHG